MHPGETSRMMSGDDLGPAETTEERIQRAEDRQSILRVEIERLRVGQNEAREGLGEVRDQIEELRAELSDAVRSALAVAAADQQRQRDEMERVQARRDAMAGHFERACGTVADFLLAWTQPPAVYAALILSLAVLAVALPTGYQIAVGADGVQLTSGKRTLPAVQNADTDSESAAGRDAAGDAHEAL